LGGTAREPSANGYNDRADEEGSRALGVPFVVACAPGKETSAPSAVEPPARVIFPPADGG
jgi:hypothetical protein